MVYLTDLKGHDAACTIALFGFQDSEKNPRRDTLSTMMKLIQTSAGHVDCFLDTSQNDGDIFATSNTVILVAYWLSSSDYKLWWEGEEVQGFWRSLPDSAGVWREIMTIAGGRFMHASSLDSKTGLARMTQLQHSSNEGYWGVYRNRLPESKNDDFKSRYSMSPSLKHAEGTLDEQILESPDETRSSKRVLNGRVNLPRGLDNMCFVREYQSLRGTSEIEQDTWSKQIAPHAEAWIDYLDKQRSKNGILSFRTTRGIAGKDIEDTGLVYDVFGNNAELDQFAIFLDLAHFERAGKSYGEHIKLRKNAMGLFGPGGELSKSTAHLMVELCILKAEDFEAEYVGCIEGTGLMHLEPIIGPGSLEDGAKGNKL